MNAKSLRNVLLLSVVAGGGIAAAAYAGLFSHATPSDAKAAKSAAEPPPAVAVTVAPATPRTVERRVRVVGTLSGFEEVEIGPLVDGPIRHILHDVGDIVAPGDVLLEIDDSDFRLAAQEMRRALDLELTRLGLTSLPDASFDVNSLPAVYRAHLVEQNAVERFERYQSMFDQNALSKNDFKTSELNLDVARLDTKQQLIAAEQSLASVRHRLAILDMAEKRLRDTRVITPAVVPAHERAAQISLISTVAVDSTQPIAATYTVAERFVSEGEIVRASPPTKLFRLVVENPLKLQAAVPERFAGQLQVGQSVDLAVECWPGRKLPGRVMRVNPTVDIASRTFLVEVAVPNDDHLLKPGSFATASILVGSDIHAITVPEEAIIRFAGVTKLFAVSENAAVAVPVELGTRLEIADVNGGTHRWVEIIGAVTATTPVVTSGHAQLVDGTAVRVRETSQPKEMKNPTDRDVREARHSSAGSRKDAR